MAIVLDGNLGITSPAETVQGALTTTGNTILGDSSADTLNVGNGGLVKDASGNVGIGTASPNANSKLTLTDGTAAAQYFISTGAGGDTAYIALQKSADGLTFGCENRGFVWKSGSATVLGGTERMRIDSSGNLLVGTTSNPNIGKIGVTFTTGSSTAWVSKPSTDSSPTTMQFLNSSGTAVGTVTQTASATAYNTSSDYRLKENIASMTGALARIALLKPVTYKWKVDGSDGEGFIAHELAEVVPDCVYGEKDAVDAEGKPVHQGIDTSFLVATLTAAIQEQQALIIQLQADVATLKALSA